MLPVLHVGAFCFISISCSGSDLGVTVVCVWGGEASGAASLQYGKFKFHSSMLHFEKQNTL